MERTLTTTPLKYDHIFRDYIGDNPHDPDTPFYESLDTDIQVKNLTQYKRPVNIDRDALMRERDNEWYRLKYFKYKQKYLNLLNK